MPPPSSACPPSLYLERWISGCVDGSVCHTYIVPCQKTTNGMFKIAKTWKFSSLGLGVHIRIIPKVGVRRNSNNSSDSFLPSTSSATSQETLSCFWSVFLSRNHERRKTPRQPRNTEHTARGPTTQRLTDLAKRVSWGHPNGTETVVLCKLLPSESDLIP